MSSKYFWEQAPKNGRPRIIENPEQLCALACEYFKWVEDNPLEEQIYGFYQGDVTKSEVEKKRPMTLSGLKCFLGIGRVTWGDYRERPEFMGVCEWIEDVIYTQKFEGAAAGFFNSGLISRDLGLADRKEVTGRNGGPMEMSNIDWSQVPTDALEAVVNARRDTSD